MADKTYDWHSAACSPPEFPCTVLSGALTVPDGGSVRLPFRYEVDRMWGESSSIELVGPDTKPVPDSLHLLYFAARERKFYKGSFDLKPLGIDSVFEHGYISLIGDEHKNFDEILVGLAPGGKVMVWTVGTGRVVELGMFQAEETQYDTASLIGTLPNLEAYVATYATSDTADLSRPDLSRHAASKYSGIYRQQFSWKPECLVRGKVKNALLFYFNGELHYEPDLAYWNTYHQHPIPSRCRVRWETSVHSERSIDVYFEETEIIAAFQKLAQESPGVSLDLKIEIGSTPEQINVFLSDGKHLINLKRCTFD